MRYAIYLGIFGSLVPLHTQQKLYNAHSLDPADNSRGGGWMHHIVMESNQDFRLVLGMPLCQGSCMDPI